MTPRKHHPDTSDIDELAQTEALLDDLDPTTLTSPEADAGDLRQISEAATDIDLARETLAMAVAHARARGRSWGQIGMVLGVSKQAARERFTTPAPRTAAD